ncbi:MAG: TolC family protein [Vicinamibacterales bacterium]
MASRPVRRRCVVAASALLHSLMLSPEPANGQVPSHSRALSLSQALEAAVGASEAVRIAQAEVTRATADITRARSARFPQVVASGSYTRTLRTQFSSLGDTADEPPPADCVPFTAQPGLPLDERIPLIEQAIVCQQAGGGLASSFARLPFGRANQWTAGLGISQDLYAGGRIDAQITAARSARDAADVGLDAARAQQTLVVADAYYSAVLADRLVDIVSATVDQAQQTLQQTILARQVGTRPEFDVLRARVAVESLQPTLIQQRAAGELAYLRLKQLLDLPPEADLQLTDTLDAPVESTIASADSVEPPPTEDRAPVRQAAAAIAIEEQTLRTVRAGRLPGVSLSGQFQQLAYPSTIVPSFGDFVSNWTIGVGVQVPLFTGGRLGAERAAAEARLTQARAQAALVRELTDLDTRGATLAAEAATAAWRASASTVTEATAAYRIAEIRFREGLSTQLELSDSRLQLLQALVDRARTEREFRIARLRLALLPRLPLSGGAMSTTLAGAGSGSSGAPAGAGSVPVPQPAPTGRMPQDAAGSTGGTGLFGGAVTPTGQGRGTP